MEPEVRAAVDLWIPLAAAGWGHYLAQGRGVLLVNYEELVEARGTGGGRPPSLEPGYVPLTMIPSGDDFRPLLMNYDPTRQVMLLVRGKDGEERLVTLECDGVKRPAPEACYQSQH